MKKRVTFFLFIWIAFWLFLVNYYSGIFPFNDPILLLNGESEEKIYALNKTKQNEVVSRMFSFFDNKIGAQKFSYDIAVYNNFKLAIEATEPQLTYVDSLMEFHLYGETKEVPYNTTAILWRGLQKDEIFNVIESIGFKAQKDGVFKGILLGPGATLTISTFGSGFIRQDLDWISKLILFILSLFLLIWLIGSFQVLINFLRNGSGWRQ